MPIKNALFVSPCMPADRGYGTAMRAGALLRALAPHYNLHLLLGLQYGMQLGLSEADLPVPVARCIKAGELLPENPSPSPKEFMEQVGQAYTHQEFDLIFVFRMESYLIAQPYLTRSCQRWLDMDELDSLCFQRVARLHEMNGNQEQAQLLKRKAKVMKVVETQKLAAFHRIFVCSEIERSNVATHCPGAIADYLPNTYPPVLNPPPPAPPAPSPFVFLYIGMLYYYPNVDAVCHFAREIFPLIQKGSSRAVEFHIAGSGSHPDVSALANQPGVRLLGQIPSISEAYSHTHALVVPLRAGGGTRVKILEAFANRRPVVSTTLGAEGMEIESGRDLELADTPEHFAERCLHLMDHPEYGKSLIRNAAAFLESKHSEKRLGHILSEAITSSSAIPV